MNFFELYHAMDWADRLPDLPDPTENLQTWLDRFKGMSGSNVMSYLEGAHKNVISGNSVTLGQKAGLELIGLTAAFLKRFHTRSMKSIISRLNNPSNWEKDNYAYGDYKELKNKGIEPPKDHPWKKFLRRYHEDHWRSMVSSLNQVLNKKDVTLDSSPESVQLQRAWNDYKKIAFSSPISQWKDRTTSKNMPPDNHYGSI